MIWLADKILRKGFKIELRIADCIFSFVDIDKSFWKEKLVMKTSKGKGPANGVAKTSKKLQHTSSGKVGKEKQKDPVEVHFNETS